MDDILNLYTALVIMLYYMHKYTFSLIKKYIFYFFHFSKLSKAKKAYYLYIFYKQGKKSNILITND